MASIKLLNISLVLLCILATAFICTYLAITSSNTALDDTKGSRDNSVSAAFTVGEESVKERTAEHVELLMGSTMDYLESFTKAHQLVSMSIAREIESGSWDEVKNMGWHRLPRYYYNYNYLRPDGNSGITVLLRNRLVVVQYEAVSTLTNPPDGYHELRVLMNYGDDSPWGGIKRTFRALNDGKGGPLNVTNPLTDVNWNLSSCIISSNKSWAEPDNPCVTTDVWDDPLDYATFWVPQYWIDQGATVWGPPVAVDIHVGITCYSPVYHNGVYSGAVTSQADVRHISEHLARLKIAGPVAGYPSRGRVFVTVRSTLLPLLNWGYEMVGASHGQIMRMDFGVVYPTYSWLSDDYIIRTIGQTVNSTSEPSVEDLMVEGNYTVLNISTPYKPEGEEFYYRIGNLKDDYGIDWYVHVVVDREYILGKIDQMVNKTHEEIKASEEHVDSNLKAARTVLYIAVVAVAVGLIALSAVLVFRIIEPLNVLEREMAAVAVMELEEVDTTRPLSILKEVRLMQVSFLQMIENLVEYRNYMPASVLQHDSSGSDDESVEKSVTHTQSTVTSSRSEHRLQNLLGAEIHAKRVTLMVCNIVDFLKTPEIIRAHRISTYLATGLHHLKASRGISDSFSGDRLYASWNGVRVCASHRVAAYQCAKDMCGDKGLGLLLSIGLVSGDVRCGNMGCDGMKRFTYIGSLSSWVHVVERIGRSMECEVAIDATVNEDVCIKAYTRMLQHVLYPKKGQQVNIVHEALGEIETAKEEEWMYQLEERQARDPYKSYNRSYELFMEGKVSDALSELGNFTDGTRSFANYKARLCAAALDPERCGPLGRSGVYVQW